MSVNEKKRVIKEALRIVDDLGDLISNDYFIQEGPKEYIFDDDLEDLIKKANKLKKSRVWKLE